MKQRRGRSDAEQRKDTWASVFLIQKEVFDIGGVLAGRKSFRDLKGLTEVFLGFGMVAVHMLSQNMYLSLTQQLTQAVYMRDNAAFKVLFVKNLVVSFVNMSLYYPMRMAFQSRLVLAWREHLLDRVHEQYFDAKRMVYLKQQNLRSGSISDIEDHIVRDVETACRSISSIIFSNTNNILLLGHSVYQMLTLTKAWHIPVSVLYCCLSIWMRSVVCPALIVGRMSGRIAVGNSEYRSAHHALLQHGEAVIASGGVAREAERLRGKFERLMELWKEYQRVMVRYGLPMRLMTAGGGGSESRALINASNLILHIPLLLPGNPLRAPPGASTEQTMAANSAMLAQLGAQQSVLMFMVMRLDEMFQMPRMILTSSGGINRVGDLLRAVDVSQFDEVGTATATDTIKLSNVNVDTPTGTRLINNLSLECATGGADNLLVVGENGVGKTSLFRSIAGLWPVADGTVERPAHVLYIPQAPFVPDGLTLPELVCYPLRPSTLPSEAEIGSLFEMVGLDAGPLLQRQRAATDEPVDWPSALSRGQKQRLSLARMLHHKPAVAVLDECTGGLAGESERRVYKHCADLGITVITVAQKPVLEQFHARVLTLPGDGSWSLEPVSSEKRSELLRTQTRAIEDVEELATADKEEANRLEAAIDARSRDYAAAHEKKQATSAPVVRSNVERLGTVLKIICPRVTLADRGIQLLIAQFALLVTSVTLSTGLVQKMSSSIQGIAMQGAVGSYIRMTLITMGLSAVSTALDISLQYTNTFISMHWTRMLDRHVMAAYTDAGRFFALSNVDKRITDSDTRITIENIELCEQISKMLKGSESGMMMSITQSNSGGGGFSMSGGIIRPIYSAIMCTVMLIRVRVPLPAMLAMWGYGLFSILSIAFLSPDYSFFAAESQKRSGAFRKAHTRVKNNAESIAFSGGGAPEKSVVESFMHPVIEMSRKQIRQNMFWMPIDMYFRWGLPRLVSEALRLMWANRYGTDDQIVENKGGTDISNTGTYISSLVMQSFQTYYGLFSTYEQFATLFGVVRRVTDLIYVLEDLKPRPGSAAEQQAELAPVVATSVVFSPRGVRGKAERGDGLVVEGCDVVTPKNRCLAKGLSFTVEPANSVVGNLAVTGPSGCGKTALCRVLSGLWPLPKGSITLPAGPEGAVELHVVAQQPLVPTTSVSLRDFVTYPDVVDDWDAAEPGIRADLRALRVGGIVDREGWGSVEPWHERLSLGEQQALAIVRLLQRKPAPRFVVLDECLSGVGDETVRAVFEIFAARHIRAIAVAQTINAAAAPFMAQELRMGESTPTGWSLGPLGRVASAAALDGDSGADVVAG